jgi:hypothetical protein
MKDTILKLAVLMIFIPSVGMAVPKGGAARTTLHANSARVDIEANLAASEILNVDAEALQSAMQKSVINADQVNSLLTASDKAENKALVTSTLKMISMAANYSATDITGTVMPKIDNARKRALELVIESTNGADHSADSLQQIMNTMSDKFEAQDSAMETAAALEATLEKTATQEAKAEKERTNEDLLELFGKCKSV